MPVPPHAAPPSRIWTANYKYGNHNPPSPLPPLTHPARPASTVHFAGLGCMAVCVCMPPMQLHQVAFGLLATYTAVTILPPPLHKSVYIILLLPDYINFKNKFQNS